MEDKILDVDMHIRVTSQDVDDIMCVALEGGITHWCDEAKPVGGYLGTYASEQIRKGGKLILHDYVRDGEHCLNLEKLLNGIKLWIKSCNRLEQVDGKLVVDCYNVDGEACDAIIQYALFGDVVYG